MRRHERNIWWLLLGICGLSGLAWFANTFSPDSALKIVEFLLILAVSAFLLAQYLLNNVRRATLLSIGLTTIFILRFLGLRDPIYIILLLATLASLELLLSKR